MGGVSKRCGQEVRAGPRRESLIQSLRLGVLVSGLCFIETSRSHTLIYLVFLVGENFTERVDWVNGAREFQPKDVCALSLSSC